ncbi:hypothetical protein AAFF_G00339370 [Aldrovandia affinis]|uniref:Uncharacterized protein n=1 Tax=Aldrovandia affinis TaxID=143900 RepID=A0AAD7SK82_9TELE|nr:hypothetical protein AAFF_G00339370 [Aldrovandia affinis]
MAEREQSLRLSQGPRQNLRIHGDPPPDVLPARTSSLLREISMEAQRGGRDGPPGAIALLWLRLQGPPPREGAGAPETEGQIVRGSRDLSAVPSTPIP